MKKPKVSVIMGIYNCEKTLAESIESLLNQTYQDFEVILCDDGSEDNTYKLAKHYYDKYPGKFILLKNKKNMGLNYTLNVCLEAAKGEYIARMDGDDISLPRRFEKQVNFLNANSDIDIVSSPMILFDEKGNWGRTNPIQEPESKDIIKGTPFAHAASMVRKKAYDAVNGYTVDKKLLRVEDYHLWIKMYSKGFKGYNIKEPLYRMRDDQNAENRRTFKGRLNEAYVKFLALKMLKLPMWYSIFIVRPILVGMLPKSVYSFLHKKKLSENK